MLFDRPLINSNILRQTKSQIYIAPHPLLSHYIAHYTVSFPIINPPKDTAEISKEKKFLTLIPDASGCMIYTYENDRISQHMWGPTTKIVKVENDSDASVYRFFIEFLPGGLHALTGITQSELSDTQYGIGEVDSALSQALMKVIESAKDLNEVIERMNTIFLKAIDSRRKTYTDLSPLLNYIKYYKGSFQVKDLAADYYISHRHLNRLFERHIGMNVKQFARLVRINKTVDLYKTKSYSASKEVAQALGFFDESHLIRDFKELCGTTPNAFLKNMSNFYNEPFKY